MTDRKQLARDIFHRALAAIDVPATMRRKLARDGSRISVGGTVFDLKPFRRVRAVAMGKVALPMARGLVDVLSPDIAIDGIAVAPHDALAGASAIPGFRTIGAGHPVPDAASLTAARAILALLGRCDAETLVFFLISGGGSALVEQPLNASVSLADLRELHRLLVTCGAAINEINIVRKHVSAVKGGRLAVAACDAMKLTLGVSDVPRGRESALASGPTLPDPSTVDDARDVIKRYGLAQKAPQSIRGFLADGADIPETPKAGDIAFERAHFVTLLNSHHLFHRAHRATESHGYVTICDNTTDDWPIADSCDYLLDRLAALAAANPGRPVAVIADGELSSPVTGDGVGGRNSAFVLQCLPKIAGKNITVLSAGTDGKDGSSPAAGAVADGQSLARAREEGLDAHDFALRSDSYNFFRLLGDAVVTGPTGNNLRDLRVLLADNR